MTVVTDSLRQTGGQRRMTLQEFLTYDDGTDDLRSVFDHRRYQLVDGVLIEMGAESTGNLRIAMFLIDYFLKIVGFERVGIKEKIEVRSRFATARDTDIIIHSEASSLALDGRSEACLFWGEPNPLVVIEVVSPGNESKLNYKRDYEQKPVEYADGRRPTGGHRGISEMWQIDPLREWVRVGTLINKEYQFETFMEQETIVSQSFPALNLTASQVLSAGRTSLVRKLK
ncbi:MAG: Uma2 family endonuclease [Alkalinema sp. CAN_BIN05]|nr:Uma2 family endonuclease [Alkalinema sp. CAN_BIN05]